MTQSDRFKWTILVWVVSGLTWWIFTRTNRQVLWIIMSVYQISGDWRAYTLTIHIQYIKKNSTKWGWNKFIFSLYFNENLYGILIYKYTKQKVIFEGHQNFWEFVKNAEMKKQSADVLMDILFTIFAQNNLKISPYWNACTSTVYLIQIFKIWLL